MYYLTYQWQLDGTDLVDGTNISGSQSNNLIISAVDATHEGIYTCIVEGDYNTVNSNNATLTVIEIISIVTHPSTISRCENDDAYFEIGSLLIGNKTTMSKRPHGVLPNRLIHPVSEVMLESGLPKKKAMGSRYHTVEMSRLFQGITALNEFQDLKRTVGKTQTFAYYENLDRPENVFIGKRIDDFEYKEVGVNIFQDGFMMEELAG